MRPAGEHMPIRLPGEPQALIAMGNPPDSIQHCPLTQTYVVYFHLFGYIMEWERGVLSNGGGKQVLTIWQSKKEQQVEA